MPVDFGGMERSLKASFGVSGTYTPVSGIAFSLTGVLDTGELARSRRQGIYGTLWVLYVDCPTPKKGDSVSINGASFVVASDPDDSRDGDLGTYLYLRKQ
jgi:hypothetical protein